MTTTARLDDEHEEYVNRLTQLFRKGKSELIRDAVKFYAENKLSVGESFSRKSSVLISKRSRV